MVPALSWYVARTGGLMAWWLLSAATMWGLLLSSRILGDPARNARLQDLHRFLAGLAVVFLAVHLIALLTDTWMEFGIGDLLVPFHSDYRPGAVAWGVVAVYLLAAVLVTSWLKPRIPCQWWRAVHTVTFAVFVLTSAHALVAGTDTAVVRASALGLGGAVTFLLSYRLLTRRAAPPAASGDSFSGPGDNNPTQGPSAQPSLQEALVSRAYQLAEGVAGIELAAPGNAVLAGWEPGAHIDLVLPSGRRRQYSLCGDPREPGRYLIAVRIVAGGRGGSAEVHNLTAGDRVAVSSPRNAFGLVLADRYLFIAGGIGITPIVPMVRAVAAAGRSWRLTYAGASRSSMPFADELVELGGQRVQIIPKDVDGRPAVDAVLTATAHGTTVYCCGPESLIAAVEAAIAAAPAHNLHLHTERFTSPPAGEDPPSPNTAFEVQLSRSGRILTVPADRSLLHVLQRAVPDIAWSCGEGYCGTCELHVVAGEPDHRDHVLPPEQRHRRDVIYPCVSRSRTPRLVIET